MTTNSTVPMPPVAPTPSGAPPNRLPRLPLGVCIAGVVLMLVAAGGAWLATPRLQAMQGAPSLDAAVPKAFGDWR
ncbi:MAG TPA: hypothetical protein VF536_03190, partial [Roseateles sp.]